MAYTHRRLAKFKKILPNRWLRLNYLYKIINKQGEEIYFEPNWAQKDLYDNIHYCNIVLKARQLGMSTFICILFLDACIFNSNVSAGIICDTRDNAKNLFKKVRFAYEKLPFEVRNAVSARTDSANELTFSNGSSIRVDTSMRSASLQYLHVSEFGKICRKYPEKAEEVITGSLQAVAAGQHVFIESTAEGRSGYFYDMCQKAMKKKDLGVDLTPVDFKFHFYPWFHHPDYYLSNPSNLFSAKE